MQPIWTDEGEQSIGIQNNKTKTLLKFPSFFPERVSPRVLTNQRSSSRLSKPSPYNKDSGSEPDDNSCSMSSSDSDAELEVLIYRWKMSWLGNGLRRVISVQFKGSG